MRKILFIFCVLLIGYMVSNTGVFSEEFDVISGVKGGLYFADTPLQQLTHYIWYRFFTPHNQLALNILKTIYTTASFFMIFKFFTIFLGRPQSLMASFLFIFFPSHEATVYCFMAQYLMLSFAFYMFAFYLAHNNRMLTAFLFAGLGSFISYGSTPVAIGLFTLFALKREFKKGASLLIPNVIYGLYFAALTVFMNKGNPRVLESVNVSAVIRQFALQVMTFIDATFGPSFVLKLYHAFGQLSLVSIILGIAATLFIYRFYRSGAGGYDSKFILSGAAMLVCAFLMFAATGRYPQLAFNLGNRVSIYGALLPAYLIASWRMPRPVKAVIFGMMIFAALGISDHWKQWNLHQQEVMKNIGANEQLNGLDAEQVIYVSGNQYSRYGPFSHIEFLSEDWAVSGVFKVSMGRDVAVRSLNKRHRFADGRLMDTKYGMTDRVDGYINIYDSQKDIVFRLRADEINSYIDSLPRDNRHWIQLFDVKTGKDIGTKLMPRLKYAM